MINFNRMNGQLSATLSGEEIEYREEVVEEFKYANESMLEDVEVVITRLGTADAREREGSAADDFVDPDLDTVVTASSEPDTQDELDVSDDPRATADTAAEAAYQPAFRFPGRCFWDEFIRMTGPRPTATIASAARAASSSNSSFAN